MMTPIELIQDELNAPIQQTMKIDDCAMDSLEYIELIHRLEQIFEIRIDDVLLEDVETFGDLCRVVNDLRNIPRV